MTDAELAAARENWYKWFHECRCGLWHDGDLKCPIMRIQGRHIGPEPNNPGLRFYPEAIWGDPSNKIWFMAMNPSLGEADAAERAACTNDATGRLLFSAYKGQHDLVVHKGRRSYHVFDDCVSKAALALLLGRRQFVNARDVESHVIKHLAVVNMAHCKCPDFSRNFSGRTRNRTMENCKSFLSECGEQTLRGIALWAPRIVVSFGRPVYWWLQTKHLHGCDFDIRGADPDAVPRGWSCRLTVHSDMGDRKVEVIAAPHPSRGKDYDYDVRGQVLLELRSACRTTRLGWEPPGETQTVGDS